MEPLDTRGHYFIANCGRKRVNYLGIASPDKNFFTDSL